MSWMSQQRTRQSVQGLTVCWAEREVMVVVVCLCPEVCMSRGVCVCVWLLCTWECV